MKLKDEERRYVLLCDGGGQDSNPNPEPNPDPEPEPEPSVGPEVTKAIEETHKLVKQLREKAEAVEKGAYTKADFKEFEEKVNKRLDELETKMKRPPLAAIGEQDKEKSSEMKAFMTYLRKGEKALTPEEMKVMQIAEDPAGGYISPIELSTRIITTLTEISPIRQIVTVETIGVSGVEFPKEGADTVTAAWPDETLVAGDFKWKMERLAPHELRALVTVKKTLLEDSSFNLEAYIIRKSAEKFAKKEGAAFVSGNAVQKPEGFLQNDDVQETKSGDASAVKADTLIELAYAIPDPYATGAKFVMKRATIGKIRLLKDSYGQYLWQPGLHGGQPSFLLGYPVVEAIDMPAVAADAYPITFGDFKTAYLIVDRIDIEVQRLVEKYALEGLVGFLFRKRTDAHVVVAEAIRKYKIAT